MLTADNAMDADDATLTYTFKVATDASMSTVLHTSDAVAAGPRGSTSWLVPAALQHLSTYYWTVTATDPHGGASTSEVASFTVFIGRPNNRQPGIPGLDAPAANAVVTSLTPALVANAATDEDGDTLSYVFELDTSPAFGSSARQQSPAVQAGTDGKARWEPAALSENGHYFWRVRAMDGSSASDWLMGSFTVSSRNDAPSAPVALSPSEELINTARPVLRVQNAMDPEHDALTYDFEVRAEDGSVVASGTNVAEGNGGTTSFTLTTDLTAGSKYKWVARAKDAGGATGAYSAEAHFEVYKVPPQPPPPADEGCSAAPGSSAAGLLPMLALALGLLGRRRRQP
jgi:uncharacterized protein (TIGR03382 family)